MEKLYNLIKTIQDNYIKFFGKKHTDKEHGKDWEIKVGYIDKEGRKDCIYCVHCNPHCIGTCLDWGNPQESD